MSGKFIIINCRLYRSNLDAGEESFHALIAFPLHWHYIASRQEQPIRSGWN